MRRRFPREPSFRGVEIACISAARYSTALGEMAIVSFAAWSNQLVESVRSRIEKQVNHDPTKLSVGNHW